jgi:presenilin 1
LCSNHLQCFVLINILFIFVFLIYFGLFFGIYFQELLHEINYIVVDKITAFLIISNYAMVGIVTLFISGPKIMAQPYHVILAAIIALTLIKIIPSWTTWVLLFAVSIWDIYAVLHENGIQKIYFYLNNLIIN